MHLRKHSDQGFDDFVRERKRVRAKLGPKESVLGYENQALRELEQVEAREVREQQLTREVHDFFAEATKQAAAIVEKVSQEAQEEQGQRLQTEVEGFLIDALSRMNTFVVSAMQKRKNENIAETQVEPDVKHLVGPELDEFRYAGTPEARDAHIGQDPFATPVEEVQAEFRAVVAELEGKQPKTASIDEHLVAEASEDEDDAYESEGVDEEYSQYDYSEEEEAELEEVEHVEPEPQPTTHSEAAAPPEQEGSDPDAELETFKNALKALVRQGVMQREEARAAWLARLESMGRRG